MKKTKFDAATEARRIAREKLGPVQPLKIIIDKRFKAPKHKKAEQFAGRTGQAAERW